MKSKAHMMATSRCTTAAVCPTAETTEKKKWATAFVRWDWSTHSLLMYALFCCFEMPCHLVQGIRHKMNRSPSHNYPHASVGAEKNGSLFKTVGIIVQGPPVKGIFRDAECLIWALTADSPRANSEARARISIFYTYNYALLDQVRIDLLRVPCVNKKELQYNKRKGA